MADGIELEASRDLCGRIWIEIGTKGRGTDGETPLRVHFPTMDRKHSREEVWKLAKTMAGCAEMCGLTQLELE